MVERSNEELEQVYAARSPEELNSAYAGWAEGYDRDTLAAGYCLPFQVLAWVARYVKQGAGPLLDAGCGSGLSGPYLAALGYSQIEGLDFSAEMLQLAGTRGAYTKLERATLGDVLPWDDNHFAAFFSTGVFTEGHAPSSSLAELCRITRPGGMAIFTVRDAIFHSGGFDAMIAELADRGIWRRLEQSPPFRAFALDEPDVLVRAHVFEILA